MADQERILAQLTSMRALAPQVSDEIHESPIPAGLDAAQQGFEAQRLEFLTLGASLAMQFLSPEDPELVAALKREAISMDTYRDTNPLLAITSLHNDRKATYVSASVVYSPVGETPHLLLRVFNPSDPHAEPHEKSLVNQHFPPNPENPWRPIGQPLDTYHVRSYQARALTADDLVRHPELLEGLARHGLELYQRIATHYADIRLRNADLLKTLQTRSAKLALIRDGLNA